MELGASTSEFQQLFEGDSGSRRRLGVMRVLLERLKSTFAK